MLLLPAALALLPGALAGAVSIHDSLATSSSASVAYGGSFTGAGWRVDDSNSRLFWDFGTQVDTGDISVTIDDISWDNLTGANNHLIELFDSGGHFSGATRAINLRVYGAGDGTATDWGEVKLKVWDASNAAEARASAQDWDGGPHVWRITWNPSECILYRDGVVLVDLDVSMIDTRVGTLWLPLDDWTGDYSAPIGTLYSNLSVDATEPFEDTGPADDGDPSTFNPTDDVSAANWESSVFPDDDDLNVEGDGAAATAVAWMRFDLSAVTDPVTSATLTVHAQEGGNADGDPGSLYVGSDVNWTEDSLMWSNQPALGAMLGSYGHVNPSDTLSFDVTSQVHAGSAVAFAIASTGSNGAHFSSKEDGDDTLGPILRITTGSSSGDSGGSSDNGGDNGGDNAGDTGGSGNSGDNGGDRDTSDDAGPHPEDTGAAAKSGCATVPGNVDSSLLGACLLAAGLAVRRRR